MAPIIPLRRGAQEHKVLTPDWVERLRARFGPLPKSPDKSSEMRFARPEDRRRPAIAAHDHDALVLEAVPLAKFVSRARRSAKLRLFRVWKLFDHLKSEHEAIAFRPVAERLRAARAMLRL